MLFLSKNDFIKIDSNIISYTLLLNSHEIDYNLIVFFY